MIIRIIKENIEVLQIFLTKKELNMEGLCVVFEYFQSLRVRFDMGGSDCDKYKDKKDKKENLMKKVQEQELEGEKR